MPPYFVVSYSLLVLLDLLHLEVCDHLLQVLDGVPLGVGGCRESLQVLQRGDHLLHQFSHVLGPMTIY